MLAVPLFWVFAVQQENERPPQRRRDRMGLKLKDWERQVEKNNNNKERFSSVKS